MSLAGSRPLAVQLAVSLAQPERVQGLLCDRRSPHLPAVTQEHWLALRLAVLLVLRVLVRALLPPCGLTAWVL